MTPLMASSGCHWQNLNRSEGIVEHVGLNQSHRVGGDKTKWNAACFQQRVYNKIKNQKVNVENTRRVRQFQPHCCCHFESAVSCKTPASVSEGFVLIPTPLLLLPSR